MPIQPVPDKSDRKIDKPASRGMRELLLDSSITKSIARSFDRYELVLLQVQRDLAEKGDDDLTLQTLKGLGAITETLKLFQAEGLMDIAEQEKNNQ